MYVCVYVRTHVYVCIETGRDRLICYKEFVHVVRAWQVRNMPAMQPHRSETQGRVDVVVRSPKAI